MRSSSTIKQQDQETPWRSFSITIASCSASLFGGVGVCVGVVVGVCRRRCSAASVCVGGVGDGVDGVGDAGYRRCSAMSSVTSSSVLVGVSSVTSSSVVVGARSQEDPVVVTASAASVTASTASVTRATGVVRQCRR